MLVCAGLFIQNFLTCIVENKGLYDPDLYEGDMILTPEQRMAAEMGLDVDNPMGKAATKTDSGLEGSWLTSSTQVYVRFNSFSLNKYS